MADANTGLSLIQAARGPDREGQFPIARAFTWSMGTGGLALTWLTAERVFQLDVPIHLIPLAVSVAVFGALSIALLFKLIADGDFREREYRDSANLNYYATVPISLIIFSSAFADRWGQLALVLFVLGSGLHFSLTLVCLSRWISDRNLSVIDMNPAWFMPVVGNVLIPVSAVRLGFPEAGWFFFSVGAFFWPVLFALLINRLFFHPVIDEKSRPTIFIFLSPPAVAFIAHVLLQGGVDRLGAGLFYVTAAMAALLLAIAPWLLRSGFSMAWWSFSFPTCAAASATLVFLEARGTREALLYGGAAVVAVATVVVTLLIGLTAAQWWRSKGSDA